MEKNLDDADDGLTRHTDTKEEEEEEEKHKICRQERQTDDYICLLVLREREIEIRNGTASLFIYRIGKVDDSVITTCPGEPLAQQLTKMAVSYKRCTSIPG